MSDIKVGDLVMVVKPSTCCGDAKEVGHLFVVNNSYSGWCGCENCGYLGCDNLFTGAGVNTWIEGVCLKKIQPLSDTDTIETIKELEHE